MSSGPPDLTVEHKALLAAFGVSRETFPKLETYHQLLHKWQRTINLVSPDSLRNAWQRHFIDSAQLRPFLAPRTTLIDLGSGAGFPGLVLGIAAPLQVQLVESDRRKAAFLRTVARMTGTDNVVIHATRSEDLSIAPAELITARALAPLAQLLEMADRFRHADTEMIFLKGKMLYQELTAARQGWHIECDVTPSCTDPDGHILRIFEAKRER